MTRADQAGLGRHCAHCVDTAGLSGTRPTLEHCWTKRDSATKDTESDAESLGRGPTPSPSTAVRRRVPRPRSPTPESLDRSPTPSPSTAVRRRTSVHVELELNHVEAVDQRSAKRQHRQSFAFLRACGPAPRHTQARRANARGRLLFTAGVQHIQLTRHYSEVRAATATHFRLSRELR